MFQCLDEAATRAGPEVGVGSQQGMSAKFWRWSLLYRGMLTPRAVSVLRVSEGLCVGAMGETSSETLKNNSSQRPQAATAEVPVAKCQH